MMGNMWRPIVWVFLHSLLKLASASVVYSPAPSSAQAALSDPASARITPRETNTCEGRKSPGPICESCELLATCVRHSNGWVNIPVETCDVMNGYYCNSRVGMCSNMTGPCHPFGFEGNFPCTSHGVFPDPYDCQKYHMCYFVGATLVSATVDCGSDKAFNAATGQCSLTLDNAVCQRKQFECLNAGDALPWPNSPNIFYICKATSNQDERVLYPTLYRCDDGEIFDGYYCKAMNVSATTTTTTTPRIEDPNDPSWSQENSSSAPNTPIRCTEVGLIADLENCRKYYYCSGVSGVLRQFECPLGTYYNAPLASCTLGSC